MATGRAKLLLPPLVSLTFAGSFVAGKYAIMDLGPLTATLLRYLVALAFLSCLIPHHGKSSLRVEKRHLLQLFLLGLFGIVGYHFFFFSSLRFTQVSHTGIINALTPVVTGLLAAAFIRERLSRTNYTGVLIATVGVLLLATGGSVERLSGLGFNLGDILMFVAVLNWSTYSVIVKRLVKTYSGFTITWYSALFGVLLLMPLSMTESPVSQLERLSPVTVLSILYMGAVASGIGYFLYNLSIREIGPTRTSSFVHSILPVFVTTFALLFFDEPITLVIVFSAVLIIVGLNFVLRERPSETA